MTDRTPNSAILAPQMPFEIAPQVRCGVEPFEVPLFEQVEYGSELPFDWPRTERLILDQLHHLR